MKLLDIEFVKNVDKSGDNKFVQVTMLPTSPLNAYIYRREKMDGTFVSFEVFVAKRRYKGQPLPGGLFEECDREQYPTANNFGFTAKEFKNFSSAESFLGELVKKQQDKEDKKLEDTLQKIQDEEDEKNGVVPEVEEVVNVEPKQRGRKRLERPELVYPNIPQFSMKELLSANEKWTQPLIYIALQSDIEACKVVEVCRI